MSRVLKSGSIKDPDRLFNDLAEDIGDLYKEVGVELGLKFKTLKNELDTGVSMMLTGNKKAMMMLKRWQQSVAERDCTYKALAAALEKYDINADKYCYMDSTPGSKSRADTKQTPGAEMSTTRGWTFNLKEKRGLAIIVTCDYIGTNQAPLPATKRDGDEMIKTLSDHFDYDVHTIRNKDATKDNVMKLLRAVQRYLKDYKGDKMNPCGRYKAIVFAFAGHGGSDEHKNDYIVTFEGNHMNIIADIVAAFMGIDGTPMKIPKLFFFDACRGNEWLTAAVDRAEENKEVNYRIDFATLPEHKAPAVDQWMCLVAQLLREKDVSLGDVMAEVKKIIYDKEQLYPQQPETKDRLVTGPLMLYHRKV